MLKISWPLKPAKNSRVRLLLAIQMNLIKTCSKQNIFIIPFKTTQKKNSSPIINLQLLFNIMNIKDKTENCLKTFWFFLYYFELKGKIFFTSLICKSWSEWFEKLFWWSTNTNKLRSCFSEAQQRHNLRTMHTKSSNLIEQVWDQSITGSPVQKWI